MDVSQETKDAFSQHIPEKEYQALRRVEKISELLDSKFKIPGTNFRFGLDPIISLFPVLGDSVSFIISMYLVLTMYRHGVSGRVATKMALNATIDGLIGSIPVLGSIFDFFYKANNRNIKLLKEYYYQKMHTGKVKKFDRSALAFLLLLFAGVVYMYFYFYYMDYGLYY